MSEHDELLLNELKYLRADFADMKKDVKTDIAQLKDDVKNEIKDIKEDVKNKCANCSVAKIAKDRLVMIWAAIVALGGALWKHVTGG